MSIDLPVADSSVATEDLLVTGGGLPSKQCDVSLRLQASLAQHLRCPSCGSGLRSDRDAEAATLTCLAPNCGQRYPIADGVPILIDESRSIFDIATFINQDTTFFQPVGWMRRTLSRCLPNPSANVSAPRNFAVMRDHLLQRVENPVVLVIGGSIVGSGLDELIDDPRITFIETDAAIGPQTQIICDGHDLPLADATVDGVIVQAVLEHVVDPHRCVAEIHRVLKPQGVVYADTPFMQQVHGRQFDFTRFTRLGHRRLFRDFQEIASGISCGPGMALAWSLRYFLLSFVRSSTARAMLSGFARLAFFWLIYLDRWLVRRPAALDAASAFYFLGQKSDRTLSDRDLIADYQGGF